ncbi:nucleotidyltransferase [Moritella sp. Urea-trap-13]|uniref:SMODS domain-containing nucleotidyltransferase n=1 Tax=Moritella sp. Urea-trap-13 TaxID=2058327 RepID=UPI000C32ABB5|nr:nucleotidyltransferase [Moritella sp. Urea-trap-13]PKH06421.1 nucleotidyltransferase [Moritella sp. Urea-trap-13]
MTIQADFQSFLNNLQIKNAGQISKRYGSITRRLNMFFRNGSENRTANSLQVGSYGRYTGISGISDLDMLYILPDSFLVTYKDNPYLALKHCKEQIQLVYGTSKVKVDRNVVVVTFKNYVIEVVPTFKTFDGRYLFPDTYGDGSWPICNPSAELRSFKDKNEQRNNNLRRLAKMVRAWRARAGINMSGFLIDTLCYRFLDNNTDFDNKSFGSYDILVRDFFSFLENEPDKAYYRAFGSFSQVNVYAKFQLKAKEARENCESAMQARVVGKESKCNLKYKAVFGKKFPVIDNEGVAKTTEEFIQTKHPVKLTNNITLDCEVKKDAMFEFLSKLHDQGLPILTNRKLKFSIADSDIFGPYELKWKVLNRGEEAERRKVIRGQIMDDKGSKTLEESADFSGDHYVECYAIQNGVVVARDRMDVPIIGEL